jgi:hypothetical protein
MVVVLWWCSFFKTYKIIAMEILDLPDSTTGMPSYSFYDHAFPNKGLSYMFMQRKQNSNKYNLINLRGYTVAQWLRHCTTNRKVMALTPDGVTGFFSLT